MLEVLLEELQDQVVMYQRMARREREETGGETLGTCAYLEGPVVASQRAVGIVRRLIETSDSIAVEVG